jgi:MPBQ/MSBQ methyltransferase
MTRYVKIVKASINSKIKRVEKDKQNLKSYQECIELYDRMVEEYDEANDVWYPHLNQQTEKLITSHFRGSLDGKSVLDVGCGTGAQSIIYLTMGASVIGIDLNKGMIRVAEYKTEQLGFNPMFFCAAAEQLPFSNETFDVVNCCGDVICYAKDIDKMIKEFARVLVPQGEIVLGFGNRISFDLCWAFLDCIIGGRLNFKIPFNTLWRHLTNSKNVDRISYPIVTKTSVEHANLNFYTLIDIEQRLTENGIRLVKSYGINSIMNFLPITLLSDPNRSIEFKEFGKQLAKLDSNLTKNKIFKIFASDLFAFGKKS